MCVLEVTQIEHDRVERVAAQPERERQTWSAVCDQERSASAPTSCFEDVRGYPWRADPLSLRSRSQSDIRLHVCSGEDCANAQISGRVVTRRVPTPRTRCNRHHCWQCSSRCCRSRCCSPAVHRVRMDECRLLLPWGWLEFSSRKSGSRERRIVTRNVSTAAAGKRRFLSIGEEFSDVPIREDP